MAGGKSSTKCLGYKVDKKIFPGGRLFTGVVMLTSGTKSGDLFNKLKDIFESQHDITRIDKLEEIPAFKGTIETKYKDEARCSILDECAVRLLDSPDIKWWKVEEVESLVIETRKKCFPLVKKEVSVDKKLEKGKTEKSVGKVNKESSPKMVEPHDKTAKSSSKEISKISPEKSDRKSTEGRVGSGYRMVRYGMVIRGDLLGSLRDYNL